MYLAFLYENRNFLFKNMSKHVIAGLDMFLSEKVSIFIRKISNTSINCPLFYLYFSFIYNFSEWTFSSTRYYNNYIVDFNIILILKISIIKIEIFMNLIFSNFFKIHLWIKKENYKRKSEK